MYFRSRNTAYLLCRPSGIKLRSSSEAPAVMTMARGTDLRCRSNASRLRHCHNVILSYCTSRDCDSSYTTPLTRTGFHSSRADNDSNNSATVTKHFQWSRGGMSASALVNYKLQQHVSSKPSIRST